MRAEIVTSEDCGACRQAKIKLRGFPNAEWVDLYSERGQEILYLHQFTRIPYVIMYEKDEEIGRGIPVLKAKQMLENEKVSTEISENNS